MHSIHSSIFFGLSMIYVPTERSISCKLKEEEPAMFWRRHQLGQLTQSHRSRTRYHLETTHEWCRVGSFRSHWTSSRIWKRPRTYSIWIWIFHWLFPQRILWSLESCMDDTVSNRHPFCMQKWILGTSQEDQTNQALHSHPKGQRNLVRYH